MRHLRLLSLLSLAPVAALLVAPACDAPDPASPSGGKGKEAIGTARSALWAQIQPTITAPFEVAALQFGDAIDNDGERFIVGAPTIGRQSMYPLTTESRAGQAFVYHRPPGNPIYAFEARLVPLDGAEWDEFGTTVGISGDRAVVGSILHYRPGNCDNPGTGGVNVACQSGSAYVYERNPTTRAWLQVAQLYPSDATSGMYFGKDVAIDGTRIIVSAYKSDFNGRNDSGVVYVFERQSDGTWLQVARIDPSDGQAGAQFGLDIDLEGDQLVIGAFQDDNPRGANAGSAYVYERQGDGTWLERPKLVASDGCAEDLFGIGVSIQTNRVIVGSREYEPGRVNCVVPPASDGGVAITNSGAVYVYERQGDGTWMETAKLTPPDPTTNLRFGVNVSLSGSTALIGDINDMELGTRVGSAYIYQWAAGDWTLDREIHPAEVHDDMAFGTDVAIDGNQVVVGAYKYRTPQHTPDLGAAFVYESAAGIANGAACNNNNGQYCLSGFCSDGVCCDSACTATCESCLGSATGGVDGTCAIIPADTDPDDECAADDPSTCQRDGTCDGNRACRPYFALGTPCGATVCAGDEQTGEQTGRSCNGGGACADIPFACGNYLCNAAETACRTTCAGNADCAAAAFCDLATDECVLKRTAGAACGSNDQCATTFCVDGVCCNTACNNPCEACDVSSATRGTCTAVTGEPRGSRPKCVTTDADCAGECNGTNRAACTYPGSTTSCGTPACTDGFLTPLSCDGQGACVEGQDVDCSPFACGESACRQSCAERADCAPGYVCEGSACVPAVATCSADRKKSIDVSGIETDCGAYRCTNGACEDSCSSSANCGFGFVCNRARSICEKAVDEPLSVPVGCTVSAPGRSGGSSGSSLLSLAVAGGLALSLRRAAARARR